MYKFPTVSQQRSPIPSETLRLMGSCSESFLTLPVSGYKGVKHTSVAPYLLKFHPAYFNTCSGIYFTSASACAMLLRRLSKCARRLNPDHNCVTYYILEMYRSVLLALVQGRSVCTGRRDGNSWTLWTISLKMSFSSSYEDFKKC